MTIFTETGKIIQKFVWNHKRLQKAKTILGKMNKAGSTTLLEVIVIVTTLQTHYKVIVTKSTLHLHKN
jgi:hypothetical protein